MTQRITPMHSSISGKYFEENLKSRINSYPPYINNFSSDQYVAHGNPKTVVFWLAELKDPGKDVTLSHEHKDYRWLPCTEACNLAKFQETKDLFEACEEFLKSISTN